MTMKDEIARLIEEIRPDLYTWAYRVTGNGTDAEDAVQDAIVSMLAYAESGREIRDIRAMIFVAVRNAAISLLRKRHEALPLDFDPAAPEPTEARSDTRSVVEEACRTLRNPEQTLDIVEMAARGIFYRDIAASLGITEDAVKGRLKYLRAKLRRMRGGEQ